MRAMSLFISRAAVALALLALFAAPAARAAIELGASAHSCCPQEGAPRSPLDEPCQQLAASSCCLEIGVPRSVDSDPALAAPVFALLDAPWSLPPASEPRAASALRRADGPPLAPLAQSGVLRL